MNFYNKWQKKINPIDFLSSGMGIFKIVIKSGVLSIILFYCCPSLAGGNFFYQMPKTKISELMASLDLVKVGNNPLQIGRKINTTLKVVPMNDKRGEFLFNVATVYLMIIEENFSNRNDEYIAFYFDANYKLTEYTLICPTLCKKVTYQPRFQPELGVLSRLIATPTWGGSGSSGCGQRGGAGLGRVTSAMDGKPIPGGVLGYSTKPGDSVHGHTGCSHTLSTSVLRHAYHHHPFRPRPHACMETSIQRGELSAIDDGITGGKRVEMRLPSVA